MSGRHSVSTGHRVSPRESSFGGSIKYGAAALALVLAIVGAVVGITNTVAKCSTTSHVTLAADPTIASIVRKLVEDKKPDDLRCVDLAITSTRSATTLKAAATNTTLPMLWIPDSSLWLARFTSATTRKPEAITDSVAKTPAVLIGRKTEIADMDSWLDAFDLPDLRLGDPSTSAVAAAPIMAALTEAARAKTNPQKVSDAVFSFAESQNANTQNADQTQRIDAVVMGGGYAVASEQQALKKRLGAVSIGVPSTGTYFLDYPLVITAEVTGAQIRARRAGVALASLLSSDDGVAALSAAGFRTVNGAPLPGKRGVGRVAQIALTDPARVAEAVRIYSVALPGK